ncbi:hypothetical protein QUF49_09835 [Fictibacillus sp. b24]|uniref:hypothetical protein n=1 Tax=Fictibacillus sp. b24 TaxID=3055863 RepID=UPI0025A23425|nr:hypothetical protein [Fictibacillus sp. b24]MDM5316294.1 hypothetical protein [Fictibacillus sp. b24]
MMDMEHLLLLLLQGVFFCGEGDHKKMFVGGLVAGVDGSQFASFGVDVCRIAYIFL